MTTDLQVATGAPVHVTSLRKTFGSVIAVDGVDLSIAAGEVVALLGPNGAGKSTTIDMMLGLCEAGRPAQCRCTAAVPRVPCSAAWSGRCSRAAGSLGDLRCGSPSR